MYPIRDYLDRPLSSLPELRALGEQCEAAAAMHVGASALGAASPLEPTADALEGPHARTKIKVDEVLTLFVT